MDFKTTTFRVTDPTNLSIRSDAEPMNEDQLNDSSAPITHAPPRKRALIQAGSFNSTGSSVGSSNGTGGNAGSSSGTSGDAGSLDGTSGDAGSSSGTGGNAESLNGTRGDAGSLIVLDGSTGKSNDAGGNAGSSSGTGGNGNAGSPDNNINKTGNTDGSSKLAQKKLT
ncbi:dermokine-like [Aphidius gifuensis]|uniref:dermokine-like n=1 Tax=Aphidius gifuensis TaxID=684658 RepID=UPI001CDCF2C6|nr:dermokine-like [Aphidius gifuensis]